MRLMMKALASVSCIGMLSGVIAQNAEPAQVETRSGWRLTLGGSYRNFDKPDFSKVTMPKAPTYTPLDSPGGTMSHGQMVDEVEEAAIAAGQDPYFQQTQANRMLVSYGGSSSYTVMEGLAPVVGAAKDIWMDGALTLSLLGNVQFFSMNAGASERTLDQSLDFTAGYIGGDVLVPTHQEVIDGDAGNGWAPGATGGLKKTFAMDLYVFDIGLSLNYLAVGNMQVFVAGGPTLSIADMESANGRGNNKNETEFEYGVYVSCGGTYWFNEKYGLSAEVRYDDCFGTVGTSYVRQDLDSFSGLLKFVINF